jgi:PncC family amidohydrolase
MIKKLSLARLAGDQLRRTGFLLATAESCTGGLLGDLVTDISGCSDYYLGGVVVYANAAKKTLLSVPDDILDRYGAVSGETVTVMADAIRRILGADVSLSISGIAGPLGGTKEKPVGTVWIGLSSSSGTKAELFHFSGERKKIKSQAANSALQMLVEFLVNIPEKKTAAI